MDNKEAIMQATIKLIEQYAERMINRADEHFQNIRGKA